MTEQEFEHAFDNFDLDAEYADYIMENCHGDRVICNGDTLICAMEDGYLFDRFKNSLVDQPLV